ncbi:MAG: putative alpha/beta-hydrolase family hydrolase [Alteromonadaceae bacterium]|jgi:predicted alpha/beta-hydrolase family hydrolase
MITQLECYVKSPKALLIFAHGAGANMHHVYLDNITRLLNEENINVLRFNFPYMDKRAQDGKKYPPNRMPILLECYQEILARCDKSLPLFIGGKSMGGRVAATLTKDHQANIKGVVCLGYPFHPTKKPEKLRLEPLQETKKPILILQGDRDSLGNKMEIENYQISSLCQVTYFEDGDHDLKPRVKSGFTQQQHLKQAVDAISRFIDEKS